MKRYILIIIILALAAAASLHLYYQQIKPEDAFNMVDFPKEISGWVSEEIPLEEQVYEILETRNLLMREYKKEGELPIVVYIIFSDKNRKSSHPPEICLTGGGVSILGKTEETITINKEPLRINNLLVGKGDTREVMFYWFKAGKTFTPNYLIQQMRIMLSQLQGKSSGGAMIRVSTPAHPDEQKAKVRLIAFINNIMPVIVKKIP